MDSFLLSICKISSRVLHSFFAVECCLLSGFRDPSRTMSGLIVYLSTIAAEGRKYNIVS